jgi:hypothetical protein
MQVLNDPLARTATLPATVISPTLKVTGVHGAAQKPWPETFVVVPGGP